jgi:PTS system nitrogen regulatory IIA component
MDIKEFLSPDDTLIDVHASDKSHVLKDLSIRAASKLKLDDDLVCNEILKREALGSTGIGGGVALPHMRVQKLKKPFGILARLRKPIDFDAIDGKRVDVVFLLLLPATPEAEQLNVLASVARRLRDERVLRSVRGAAESAGLFTAMTSGL